MLFTKIKSEMSPSFIRVFGNYFEHTIKPDYGTMLRMQDYETIYTKNRSSLRWEPGRHKLFEFGPYSYPRCSCIIDSFKNHTERRKYCISIIEKESGNTPILEYSKNKLFHERIEASIRYSMLFLSDVENIKPLLNKALLSYDIDNNGRIDFYQKSNQQRIMVAEAINLLSLAIIEHELTQF